MTKLKSNCRPSLNHPEVLKILVEASILTNRLQEILSEESIGKSFGVTRQAIHNQKTKFKGGSK